MRFADPTAKRFQLSADQMREVELAQKKAREEKFADDKQMAALLRRFSQ